MASYVWRHLRRRKHRCSALVLCVLLGVGCLANAQGVTPSPREVDPFRPFFLPLPQAAKKEVEIRNPTPLTEEELSQLRLISILHEPEQSVALFERPDKRAYSIRKGEAIGKRGGKVAFILHDCVVIREQGEYVSKCLNPPQEEECTRCMRKLEERGYLDFSTFESALLEKAAACNRKKVDPWVAEAYTSSKKVHKEPENCDEVVQILTPELSRYYRAELFCLRLKGSEEVCKEYPELCTWCVDECTRCLKQLEENDCLGYALEIHKEALSKKVNNEVR